MSIDAQLDQQPLRSAHWRVTLLTGLGWMFVALDITLAGFIVVALTRGWHLGPDQARSVTALGLVGMAVGAAGAGVLADWYGRRPVLIATLALFAVATGLAGLAPTLGILLVLRFLAGLGLGGEWPAAAALLTEFAPARQRGMLVVLLASFWAWGALLAALVAFLVIPRLGWQWGFFVGALPVLYVNVLRRSLPESPRYLLRMGRASAAAPVLHRLGLAPTGEQLRAAAVASKRPSLLDGLGQVWRPPLRRQTAILWLVWFGLVFAYVGLTAWLPAVLTDRGYPLTQTLGVVLATMLAQVPGFISAALLIEWVGRKWTLALYLVLYALAALLLGRYAFVAGAPLHEVVLCAALVQCFSLGALGIAGAYTPELYPTALRGTGTGWAMACGWLGGYAGLLGVPWLLDPAGLLRLDGRLLLGLFALVLALGAAAVVMWATETRGQPLARPAGDGPESTGHGTRRWVG